MAEKKEIMISMDPVMAAKFAASTHCSRKYHLLEYVLLTGYIFSHQRSFSQHAQNEQHKKKNADLDKGREIGCIKERS